MKTNIAIEYSVEFLTPFHFGSGLSSGMVDRLVRRDANGYLVVPATTMKGILREKVERLIETCKRLNFLSEPIVKIANKKEHLNFFRSISVADRIFGSPLYEGTLNFDTLIMSEMSKELVRMNNEANPIPVDYLQSQQRTQTRIMRKTKTVASGALFKSEYGNSELKFEGKINGLLEGISIRISEISGLSYELLFLLSAMRLIDRIGGNKSVGMGNIELKIDRLYINGEEIELNRILSNEIWEVIEAGFFDDDKKSFKKEAKKYEN